ncbi:1987_t:CDS:2, partial [Entrophospora sp. SA101]
MSYFTKKIADWSNPKQKMYLTPLSCSPDSDSSNSSTDSINAKKQLFELPANNSTPTSNKKSSKSSKHNNSAKLSTAFDNVEQKSLTGRLNVNIVEGRKLNVSNFQSRPYCVVEFDRDQFVTREAIRDSDLPIQRGGKPVDFLDLVRAARCPIWKQKVTFDVARLDSELQVSVYERVHHLDNAQTEVFLGTLKIQPPKKPNQPIDGWFKLSPRGKESVTGELHVQITYESEKSNLKPGSFEILKLIGKGNFGKVFQVRKKDTNRIYAMKVLHKQDLIERREVEHTLAEKNILIRAESCPFLVGLKFSFQTRTHLYLVTDFMNGGELFWHLQNEVRLNLKPENILLDATGHIALCDFGLCKENLATGQTTNTFCGTSEYLAPEVLAECGYGKSVDWWSLGILFYEMIAGFSPFYTNDTQLMYRRILFGKLKFPKGFFSDDAKSLIKGLLARNPHNRLGSNGDAEDLKRHPFFANVDWNALYNKQVPPPFKPNVTSEDDTSCFDPAFTEEQIDYWPSLTKNISRNGTNASIASELNDTFVGFTYSGEPTTTLNIGGCCGLQVNNTVASISPVQVIGGEDDKEEDLNLYNNDNVPNIISYINNIINDINNDINEIGNHINIINHHSDDNISSYNNTRSSNNTFLLDNTYSYNNTRSSNTSLLDIVTNNTFNISYSSFSYPKEIFECLIAINHPALVGNSKFKKLYWAKEVESAYNEWSNLAVADDYDDKNSISSRREEWLKLKQERLHNLHL